MLQQHPTYLTPIECAHQFIDDVLQVSYFFFFTFSI